MKAQNLIKGLIPWLVIPVIALALLVVRPVTAAYAQEGSQPAVVTPTLESLQQEVEALKVQNLEQQKTINYLTLKVGELISLLVEKGIMPVEVGQVDPGACPEKAFRHVYTDTVKGVSTPDPHCAPYELVDGVLTVTVDGVRHAFPIHYDLQPTFNPLNTYQANFIFMYQGHTVAWVGQIKWNDQRELVFESQSGTVLVKDITFGVFAPLVNTVWHEEGNRIWSEAGLVGQPFKQ